MEINRKSVELGLSINQGRRDTVKLPSLEQLT